MIHIDTQKCIGCGLCAGDCNYRCFKVEGGKAVHNGVVCNFCGHCFAICPMKAITIDEYDCSDTVERSECSCEPDPQALLNALKLRRSTRRYNGKHVPDEVLARVIEAGRFAPTGSNLQDVRFLVIRKDRLKIVRMVLDGLLELASRIEANADKMTERDLRYAATWRYLDKVFEESGRTKDVIFFGSDVQIGIVSYSDIDAGIAAQAMHMQAVAEGLGTLFNGFFRRGVDNNPALREYLGLKPGEAIYTGLCLGYTDTRYARSAPRIPARITEF